MLTETSLTNTLALRGISNIRYRSYIQSYPKTSLLSFLTCADKNPAYIENEKSTITLIKAFQELIQLNIPSVWQTIQNEEKDVIRLELWVFWFDDRHTGVIDNDLHLKQLDESNVGSFNWDQLTSNELSPTSSPLLSQKKPGHHHSKPLDFKYKLFIKSIRNIIRQSMTAKGAFSLGEFFIIPDYETAKDSTLIDQTEGPVRNTNHTMLVYTYNVYLTSSNLLFQPNTRRMRIRPLSYHDKHVNSMKVLLCPTGEHAQFIFFGNLLTPELQNQVLNQWAEFYHIPFDFLVPKEQDFPALITVKTTSNHTVTYPSMLVFVPTDTKASPSSVSGLNGVMGVNHGLTEDLGSKLSRAAYLEKLKQSNTKNVVDYWNYQDPMIYSENMIIDALSMTESNYQQEQKALHRALIEPVLASPIMHAKSVVPLHGTSSFEKNRTKSNLHAQAEKSFHFSTDLTSFIKTQFDIKDEILPESMHDQSIEIDNHEIEKLDNEAKDDATSNVAMVAPEVVIPSEHPSQNPSPIIMQDFDLIYDMDTSGGGGGRNAWDNDGDFGDLDLDVTDADFDYFETAAPGLEPNNILNIMPLDTPTVADTLPSQTGVEETDTAMDDDQAMEVDEPELCLNNESLFTPFVISHDTTEEASIVSSATVNQSEAATPIKVDLPKANLPQVEHPTFVPRDFLPVPVKTKSIDAKYSMGGKFMYDPSKKEEPLFKQSINKKNDTYTPDYVPLVKKPVNSKIKSSTKDNSAKNEALVDSESSDLGSSSSSTDDSFDSDSSESSDTDSDNSINNDMSMNQPLLGLKKFQKNVVQSLLKATPASMPTEKLRNIDYGTPFAPIIANDDINPIKWRNSTEMEASLDILCQQAIWGGFPFTGGLDEVTANGGEIEGERDKILVARRTNLLQLTRGVVTHTPSLLTDQQLVTLDFKRILQQLFAPTQSDTTDTLMPAPYLGSSSLSLAVVEGPLNIRQYYSLGETNVQPHSKYGKYQVKKKRPDEPNMDNLKQPDIEVVRYEESLEGASTMLPFWAKMGLQPYSSQKHIRYIVMYPNSNAIELAVSRFFTSLGNVYTSCHLGKHDANHVGQYRNGLVPIRLPGGEEEISVKERLKRYEETCEKLGEYLSKDEEAHPHQHMTYTVIYMVNPGSHLSSYLDMCRCFYKLKSAYQQPVLHPNAQLVLQLIPIEHVLRPSSFGGYDMWGLKDIAFSVYSKCFTVMSKRDKPNIVANLYAPPFVLSKTIPKKIEFKLDDIRPFPIILNRNEHLHLAYCFSYDRAWMTAVWIDDRGELLQYALFPRKSAFKDAWERTLKIAKSTDFLWTIAITKIGLMFDDELLYWLKYTTGGHAFDVSILALDIDSGLNLHFTKTIFERNTTQDRRNQPPSLLDASGKNVESTGKHQKDNERIHNECQMILLNHRVSYSQKRERAYKGILRLEAVTEKENWMFPLATGYLVHHSLPNKNVNPCVEQFDNEPFVVEIHLLHNRTQYSSYVTLQEIIRKFYSLSFVNPVPSNHSCIPFHVVLAERLSRLLLIVDDSIK